MKVLPADVYDTMELIAEAYGGIGADRTYVNKDEKFQHIVREAERRPMCLIGFCRFASDSGVIFDNTLMAIFDDLGINYYDNNKAVYKAIGLENEHEYSPRYAANPIRISWQEWCKQLNVVRGE